MDKSVYREEVKAELRSILRYWMEFTPDEVHGGFWGRIDGTDQVHPEAPKGLVLNSRILWTFSAAYKDTGEQLYLPVARRAFEYIMEHFMDREYGGAWWSVSADGSLLEDRKQVYGLAFCLYGLSEYHMAAGEPAALDEAIALFRVIEEYSFDKERKGYIEALTRDWHLPEDLRLSGKDANTPKTMNTHLHVLEAYANLYRCWPDPLLRQRIQDLLEVFANHIVDAGTGHLLLFFGEDWSVRSGPISYGHDIEASWLLQEAAVIIADEKWTGKTRLLALRLAGAAAEGLDTDGGLWYEREEGSGHGQGGGTLMQGRTLMQGGTPVQGNLVREKHWWPQAEAMVGFLNAWQVTGSVSWWQRSQDSWEFIKRMIRDPSGREWYWGVGADHLPMTGEDKAGFWKCPYHNSRACLEVMRRLGTGEGDRARPGHYFVHHVFP